MIGIRRILWRAVCACVIFAAPVFADPVLITDARLQALFDDAGVPGVVVVHDTSTGMWHTNDPERAIKRYFPASTFKIANSLIALETGAVSSVDEVVPYGGGRHFIRAWEQDMSLREAIVVSNLPVYQTVARRVGLAAYVDWLERLTYGNADPGDDVTGFWIQGPLAISAVEQVTFLNHLADGRLYSAEGSQEAVREITRLGTIGGRTLFGKTGWTTTPSPDIGWFIGWVEDQGDLTPFALNIDMRGRADAALREGLARQALAVLGHY